MSKSAKSATPKQAARRSEKSTARASSKLPRRGSTSSTTREPAQAAIKSARLAARVTPQVHELLQQAAELKGRSVSDFVVAAAQAAAEKTIAEYQMLTLTREAQARFLDLINDPPEPNAALQKAFRNHRAAME